MHMNLQFCFVTHLSCLSSEINLCLTPFLFAHRMYRAECSKLESEVTLYQSKIETLQTKVDRLKKSLIRMRRKNRSLVAERQTADSHREVRQP